MYYYNLFIALNFQDHQRNFRTSRKFYHQYLTVRTFSGPTKPTDKFW